MNKIWSLLGLGRFDRKKSVGTIRLLLALLFLMVLVVACSSTETSPTDTPQPVEEPTLEPTQEPAPSPTLEPTEEPTSEPTQTNTATPLIADTATPEFEPEVETQATAGPAFVFQGSDPTVPIIGQDPSAEIRGSTINPGAVLFHDGLFHMFFNSFSGHPGTGTIRVGYFISENGIDWEPVQEEPVFSNDAIPYADDGMVTSVVVLDDGTWVMYFYTIQDGQIGLATADSPTGPWQVDPGPIVMRGPTGAWDGLGLSWPQVVRDEDGYRMYYDGRSFRSAIGMATSTDGLSWTKYNDPVTNDSKLAESDPVFTAGANWEQGSVVRPQVQNGPGGWAMIYAGRFEDSRGLAFSEDGIAWEAYPDNPILTPDEFPIPNTIARHSTLIFHDGNYYYFMSIGTIADGLELFLARHDGPLGPSATGP